MPWEVIGIVDESDFVLLNVYAKFSLNIYIYTHRLMMSSAVSNGASLWNSA